MPEKISICLNRGREESVGNDEVSIVRAHNRLFTVPYFFVRSFRYTASYRHEYLDFQMYRGGGRRGL